jgi:Ca2+-binding EF-hand superfamily protein
MGGALSEDEDGGNVPGDGPGDGPAEPRTPPAARSAGDVFGASARGENAAEKTTASRSAKTPSNVNMSDMSHETMSVAIDACSACAAARLRHEASASELAEALDAARRENETLEAANGSLESRLASVESELADADAALHFERLDVDGDGRLTLDDLLRAELFASYAQPVVERIFEQWTLTQSAADEKRSKASGVEKNGDGIKSIDREGFRALCDWARRKTRTRESTRFWFRVVDVDGDGVLSRHDIKWLYDAVHKDESTCVSLADLTCQIFDMAGADRARTECARGGVRLAALRESRLADGIFGILCNHDDMLLRRSTAEFSNEHAVPM